jgi:hypothetical protein
MVKKSFFARLFGKAEETTSRAPAGRVAAGSPAGGGSAATPQARAGATKVAAPAGGRTRVADVDFDEEHLEPIQPSRPRTTNSGTAASSPRGPAQGTPAGIASSPSQTPSAPGAAPALQQTERVETKAESKPVEAQVMARQEEMSLKLQEGFNGLSNVLRGIDTKIDQQQKTSEELIVSVQRIPELMKDVPEASRAGVELLSTLSRVLEHQGRTTSELLAKMRELPGSLEAMEQRVQEQVKALAKSGAEADRIARETQRQVTGAFDGVKRVVEDVQSTSARRQEALVEELRRYQSQQEQRVDDLLKRMSGSTRLVVFLLVIAIVALLVAVYGMQR